MCVHAEKDVARTDRTHAFFQGDDNPNIAVLYDILLTHCMYNFDLGQSSLFLCLYLCLSVIIILVVVVVALMTLWACGGICNDRFTAYFQAILLFQEWSISGKHSLVTCTYLFD